MKTIVYFLYYPLEYGSYGRKRKEKKKKEMVEV